ncbi:MAG: hypothetical protein ACIAQF_05250 [Phycisphaerales bacterium JB065]
MNTERPDQPSNFARLNPLVVAAIGFSVVLFSLVLNVQRVRSANQDLQDAEDRYEQISVAANQIAAYRERSVESGPSEQPNEDVLALVAQALSNSALPSSRQQQLSSAGRIRISTANSESEDTYEDRVTVRFQPMTPDEVWTVLTAWNRLGTNWKPISLVMEISNRRDDDPVYSATIDFANRFTVPREAR